MRGRLSRLLVPALLVLLAQGVAVLSYLEVERRRAASGELPLRYERLAAGRAVPDLALVGPDGATRRMSALRGKIVLLHFWATWCPPCREELPGLLALGRELSRDGRFEVVAVALDPDWAEVRRFFGGDIPPEVVRDPTGGSARLSGVSGLPDTYLVAPDGALTLRFGGARDWSGAAARELLQAHLR